MTDTTPVRPPLARKHTRTTEENRNAGLDAGVRITIDGEAYEVRMGDVTPDISRELRRHTGMGFRVLMESIGVDPDIDTLSAFAWVARRIRGEYVAFDEVVVTYAQMLSDGFDVEPVGAEDLDDLPPEG